MPKQRPTLRERGTLLMAPVYLAACTTQGVHPWATMRRTRSKGQRYIHTQMHIDNLAVEWRVYRRAHSSSRATPHQIVVYPPLLSWYKALRWRGGALWGSALAQKHTGCISVVCREITAATTTAEEEIVSKANQSTQTHARPWGVTILT